MYPSIVLIQLVVVVTMAYFGFAEDLLPQGSTDHDPFAAPSSMSEQPKYSPTSTYFQVTVSPSGTETATGTPLQIVDDGTSNGGGSTSSPGPLLPGQSSTTSHRSLQVSFSIAPSAIFSLAGDMMGGGNKSKAGSASTATGKDANNGASASGTHRSSKAYLSIASSIAATLLMGLIGTLGAARPRGPRAMLP